MGRPKTDTWANGWWGQVRHEQKGKSVAYKTAPEERLRQMRHELAKIETELTAMYEAVRVALGEPMEHPLTDIVLEHVSNVRKILKTTEGM
jgi:hypothetical protein